MKKHYLLPSLFVLLLATFAFFSCNHDENEDEYLPVSPVVLDVTQVPYPKLSDYKFFEGEIKNLEPAYKVLPYKPASELFTDYAHKKRFVWMPAGAKATYNGDDNVLEFPVGAVLIKNFYYDELLPSHEKRIIETRLLIKQSETTYDTDGNPTSSGWHAYDYIWNEEQTEAFLDVEGNGSFVPLSFVENGQTKEAFYKIPSASECRTCHKINVNQTLNGEIMIPIGVKPQNLNNVFDYGTSQRNQLQKWVAEGYLESNIPSEIVSTVDYKDASQPLELRVRSYLDINCAHCHRVGGHCDYTNMRFNFSNSDLGQLGVCMTPQFNVEGLPFVLNAGDANNSELIYRINSTDGSVMMPFIGRSVVHEEAVALLSEWVNSLDQTCD